MQCGEKLTGKTRWRILTRWFSPPLLVQQVEVHRVGVKPSGFRLNKVDCKFWRDAKIEDFEMEKLQ